VFAPIQATYDQLLIATTARPARSTNLARGKGEAQTAACSSTTTAQADV